MLVGVYNRFIMNGFQKGVFIIGICLALLQFLGFPSGWETFFVFTAGVSVSIFTFIGMRHRKTFGEKVLEGVRSVASQVFVENGPTSSGV